MTYIRNMEELKGLGSYVNREMGEQTGIQGISLRISRLNFKILIDIG